MVYKDKCRLEDDEPSYHKCDADAIGRRAYFMIIALAVNLPRPLAKIWRRHAGVWLSFAGAHVRA